MLLILLVGVVVSGVLHFGVRYVLTVAGFDRLASRSGLSILLQRGGMRRTPSNLVGLVAGWTALALFFAVTFHLEAESYDGLIWGGAMYLPTLAAMLVFGVALIRRHAAAGRAFFVAAGLFVLSFTARTLDMPLCPALPIGTHYLWHILNATVLYLLVRVVILYAPASPGARRPASREAA